MGCIQPLAERSQKGYLLPACDTPFQPHFFQTTIPNQSSWYSSIYAVQQTSTLERNGHLKLDTLLQMLRMLAF